MATHRRGSPRTVVFPQASSSVPSTPRASSYGPLNRTPDSLFDIPLLPKRASFPSHGVLPPARPHYLCLAEAVYDDSQPEFDPRQLQEYGDSTTKLPLPPPSSFFLRGLTHTPPRHPFAPGFEPPNWRLLMIYIALCLVSYPVLLVFALVARDKPLFWTRFTVSLGCGGIGFVLGSSLLQLGKSFLEAATWATVIHQSRVPDAPGVKLKDLAANSEDPTSAWAGLRLLWDRSMYEGTSRRHRRSYDQRPWTLYILLFLLLVTVAGSIPFVLGRIVMIDTNVIRQREKYREVVIKGDSSDDDINRATALSGAFENFRLTWTLAPFSNHGGLPPVVSFGWGNDTVYFSEMILSQLVPSGSGFGTFQDDTTAPTIKVDHSKEVTADAAKAVDPGAIIRAPRWGTRVHCAKIPDGNKNLVPRSENTFTYVYTPRAIINSLFSSFGMDYPQMTPFNASEVLQLNDTLPSGLDPNETALGVHFYDNGVAHSFASKPLTMGQEGKGWVTIEHVLVRLNTTYTPNGKFLRLSEQSISDARGNPTFIGYDAAVCLQLFEPWILETYNSTIGVPNSMRIVEPCNTISDQNTDRVRETRLGLPITDNSVRRQLNSSKLAAVYTAAHQNSINQILKDNGRDSFYVPSPTVISFTSGQGPNGYTELSATYFAQARGLADASNVLPYFAGSGTMVARRYADRVLSSAYINHMQMAVYMLLVLALGVAAGLFVPRLPLAAPHRGFELYSWMAAFHADELVPERRDTGIPKNMELGEIEQRLGELKFRYAM